MNELQELFSDVDEEYDEEVDDWEIPVPDDDFNDLDDDWAETWLDGLDEEDVNDYDPDSTWTHITD